VRAPLPAPLDGTLGVGFLRSDADEVFGDLLLMVLCAVGIVAASRSKAKKWESARHLASAESRP